MQEEDLISRAMEELFRAETQRRREMKNNKIRIILVDTPMETDVIRGYVCGLEKYDPLRLGVSARDKSEI